MIGPISSRASEPSVTEPMEPAYERVKLILFKPFDLNKWIIVGFCAWLAGLGESGGGMSGFNGSSPSSGRQARAPADQIRQFYHQASDYFLANLYWIIPLSILVVLGLLALWLLVIWLSSRGKFMFLHSVAGDKSEVVAPWHKFAGPANSLFWFRVISGFVGMVFLLPLLGFLAIAILGMVLRGEPDIGRVLLAAGMATALFFVALVFGVIRKFTTDFVVPIQFLRNGKCLAAWGEFWKLLAANPGKFTVYILFQVVLSVAIGILIVTAILVTCCIAGCLLALPFLGTVLLLPVLIFQRAYPLYYLAQYGPQYDVFPPAPVPTGLPSSPEIPPLAPIV
jgi:hypothetical protein